MYVCVWTDVIVIFVHEFCVRMNGWTDVWMNACYSCLHLCSYVVRVHLSLYACRYVCMYVAYACVCIAVCSCSGADSCSLHEIVAKLCIVQEFRTFVPGSMQVLPSPLIETSEPPRISGLNLSRLVRQI